MWHSTPAPGLRGAEPPDRVWLAQRDPVRANMKVAEWGRMVTRAQTRAEAGTLMLVMRVRPCTAMASPERQLGTLQEEGVLTRGSLAHSSKLHLSDECNTLSAVSADGSFILALGLSLGAASWPVKL